MFDGSELYNIKPQPELYQVNKISAGPKYDFLPQATTTHPPTIIALKTTKTTRLGLLSLRHCFITEASLYQHQRATDSLHTQETNHSTTVTVLPS